MGTHSKLLISSLATSFISLSLSPPLFSDPGGFRSRRPNELRGFGFARLRKLVGPNPDWSPASRQTQGHRHQSRGRPESRRLFGREARDAFLELSLKPSATKRKRYKNACLEVVLVIKG